LILHSVSDNSAPSAQVEVEKGSQKLIRYVVKAHIRKASILFALREYTKAIDALDVAREHDEAAGSKSTREIQELAFKLQSAISAQRENETEQETLERAMRDPEVGVRLRLLSGAEEILINILTRDNRKS
jgi:hypothetical protein